MSLQIRSRSSVFILADGRHLNATTLELSGRVEASTISRLQKEMAPLMNRQNLHVVMNLRGMEYSTSTGMGAMLQLNHHLELQGGRLSILAPTPEVKQVIDLLGIEEILPVFKDERDLCSRYDKVERRPYRPKTNEQMDLVMMRALVSLDHMDLDEDKPLENSIGQVVMASPEENFFFIVLRERLRKRGCETYFTTSAKEAFQWIREKKASAILVDYSLKHFEELCLNIKSDAQTSSCSIVKVYPEGRDLGLGKDLSIIPNQHVMEPCSVDQVSSFLQSEVQRHHSEGEFFQHELYFSIPSTPERVAKAVRYLERVISSMPSSADFSSSPCIAAIREAIDNARRHGHRGQSHLHIRVLFLRDRDKLTVVIKDQGEGFDHEKALASARYQLTEDLAQSRPEDRPGGLGLALMTKAATSLSYNGVGNELKLVFKLS